MPTTPETPISDATITEGGVEAPYSDKPTPVMPYAASFAISPLLEPRLEEGARDRTMILNMGPQHPRPMACCAWCSKSTARPCCASCPDIGFLHTGIEKTCEANFDQQVVPNDKPHRPPLSDDEQPLLRSGSRKTIAVEATAARAVSAGAAQRTDPPSVPSGLARHARHGYRRAHRLPLCFREREEYSAPL